MEKYDIYSDISKRTGGDIYVGVVGPVRTGKSTFITRFMENLVIPNIHNKLQKQIATDEMPQSASGKTIMTTEPKFIPATSVKVQFKNKASANVRLVDCVGYLVEGASGHMEDDKPRLVKTPWSTENIPFKNAAEIGTEKVIKEYSTVGVVVTTDGSIGEIERENYIEAEQKVVSQLQEINKPFVIVLNSKIPSSEETQNLAYELEKKYGVGVIVKDVLNMTSDDINDVMEKILLEFPVNCVNVELPKWMRALPAENSIISSVITTVKDKSADMAKMKDFFVLDGAETENDGLSSLSLKEIRTDCGSVEYEISAKDGLFFKVLSEECNENIEDDYSLMRYVKSFSEEKKKYEKIKDALKDAEDTGYGVVLPLKEEVELEEPALVKQGGRYGVKVKARAPSLHIMKVDVTTEVSPVVGTEKQGEEMISHLMESFEKDQKSILETNIFGKSLNDLVGEGLNEKIVAMPKDALGKMRKTLGRMVNEGRGGIICILL